MITFAREYETQDDSGTEGRPPVDRLGMSAGPAAPPDEARASTVPVDRIWLLSMILGAVFPLVGTLVEVGVRGLPFSVASMLSAQASQPLLWIIDTAPLVLAAFGWALAGAMRESDRLRSAAATARLEQELDRFLRLSKDPLAILDEEGSFVRVSPGFTSLFGYTHAEALGLTLAELIHPEDRPGGRLAASGVGVVDGTEVRVRARNGSHREIRWSVVDVPDRSLTYVLGRDLTEDRRIHRELEAARTAANAAARAKSEFIASMSHQLRTPMNGVIGMTDLALETELTDDQRLYLEAIDESAKSLMQTISDLLDFSQMEADKLALKQSDMVPAHVLAPVVAEAQAAAADKGVAFMYEEGQGLTWELVGDEERFRQIVAELLDNAVKFTSRGEIVVSAHCVEADGDDVVLEVSVRDTGVGLDEAQSQVIFEAFSHSEHSLARAAGGSGLGLTIASQLAQMMGGRIDVESTLGAGSTFVARVPMRLARLKQEAAPVRVEDDELLGTRRHVLLVEDDRVNRVLTETMLARHGFTVTLAENGEEAVDAVRSGSFDLVLMDIQIPILDGLEATRLIRELEKDRVRRTPIVALTAHVAKGDRDACFRADMDDYIPKPVDPVRFEGVLRTHVEGPGSRFEWFRAAAIAGGDDELTESARDFLELAEGQIRVVMDAEHRDDKVALWQSTRDIERVATAMSLNRLRDISHQIAVLIGRGEPASAMRLVGALKSELRSAISVVREAVDGR